MQRGQLWPVPSWLKKEGGLFSLSGSAQHLGIYEQSMNHISLHSIDKVTNCAGCVFGQYQAYQVHWVTEKWGLLSHAQNAVMWLVLSTQTHVAR